MTDRVVLKWTVPVDDRPHRIGGGEIVHIASQHPDDYDRIMVWTVEPRNEGAREPRRVVQIFGTGHPLPFFATPLGSAVVSEGRFVWHLFELPPVDPAKGETVEKAITTSTEVRA